MMSSLARRPQPARLPSTTPVPVIPPQPLPQTQTLTLTTAELHTVLLRRLRNDNLPDDAHLLLAERITSLTTNLSSFLFKLYLLDRTPLSNLPTSHPRLTTILRGITLSQLRPLKLLTLPLLRVFRPLSWILAPFATMSLPVLVHLLAKAVIRHLTPTPPPRPKFVDTLVQHAADVCENISETVTRAREAVESDINHFLEQPPPQLPTLPALADIVPHPFNSLVTPQEEPHSTTTEAPESPAPPVRRRTTYTRNPVPSFRGPLAPPGLSALAGATTGDTARAAAPASPTRSQNAASEDLASDAASDVTEEKSWWYKRASA